MYAAGDVRIEDVADPTIENQSDAVVRVLRSAICGSDLWPFRFMPATTTGRRMGHEFIGVVEDVGMGVDTIRRGDLVVAPFRWADNSCDYCRDGLHTSCRQGGSWGSLGVDGAQSEAVRVPQAAGTLVRLPTSTDPGLLASFLTLSDVFSTGHHGALTAKISRGQSVTVVGDGAVGLCAVLAAKRLGAGRIILMGHHPSRTSLGMRFGATDVVTSRESSGISEVRDLTAGDGTRSVIECVGTIEALRTALGVVRDGGIVSRLGLPQYSDGPIGYHVSRRNVTITGGHAPARAYIETLLPDVIEGRVEPGLVFDRSMTIDDVPQGYEAMADRRALKVIITP